MCYTGQCCYESYPWGYNESCVCTKDVHDECPNSAEYEEDREDNGE